MVVPASNYRHTRDNTMAKLHELLAAQNTRNASWNQMYADTLNKFGKADHFFNGITRRLSMQKDDPSNESVQAAERVDKPVITTVLETLTDALEVFAKAEDLQFLKNKAKQVATGTVMFRGTVFAADLPMDQLLGLESRLQKIKELWKAIPTQDATRSWKLSPDAGVGIYESPPEITTKTSKEVMPVELSPASKEHPAQVTPISKDMTVGAFSTTRRTGTATAQQVFEAIKQIDELLVEIKSARQRANQTEAPDGELGQKLAALLLEPFQKFN